VFILPVVVLTTNLTFQTMITMVHLVLQTKESKVLFGKETVVVDKVFGLSTYLLTRTS